MQYYLRMEKFGRKLGLVSGLPLIAACAHAPMHVPSAPGSADERDGIVLCEAMGGRNNIPEEVMDPCRKSQCAIVRKEIRFGLDGALAGVRCTYYLGRDGKRLAMVEAATRGDQFADFLTAGQTEEVIAPDGQVDFAQLGMGDKKLFPIDLYGKPVIIPSAQETLSVINVVGGGTDMEKMRAAQKIFQLIIDAAKKLTDDVL